MTMYVRTANYSDLLFVRVYVCACGWAWVWVWECVVGVVVRFIGLGLRAKGKVPAALRLSSDFCSCRCIR